MRQQMLWMAMIGPALLPMPVMAAPWSGDAALGYLATTGNAESSSANARFGLIYSGQRWKNTVGATAVHAISDEGTSAEHYSVTEQLDFNFTPLHYSFGVLDWNKDIYAAVRERFSQTVGYGYHALSGPVHRLDLELGGGARQSLINERPRTREKDLIARGALKYEWMFSPTSSFRQALKVESGDANTYSESVSTLKLSVIGNVYANVSYTIKNNSKAAEDTRKTDSELAVTLSYEFGKVPPPG